ncbi:GerW family sporulation protein [Desulforudis sp. 1190]|uniref:GerW family sporulation protein n=1 Tax=Desulforudis sp. 1190 TaxID=3416136 RepID=UPI003CEF6DCB
MGHDDKHQGGKGSGGGAGMKLFPTALLVIQGDNVQVYSLAHKGTLEKLAGMIPEVLSKFKPQEEGE